MGEGESSRSGGDKSESEPEEEEMRNSNEEEEGKGDNKMSEYEKKRLTRIAENRARLEALGISKAAKALFMPPSIRKPNSREEDEDYRPGDETDEEEEFLSSVSNKRKSKATSPPKRKKHLCRSDPLGDDDDLNKAIALSLQDSVAVAVGSLSKKKINDHDSGSSKKKNSDLMMSKMQMTADELVLYFFQFDQEGKGFITLRDVATMATVHDFTWSHEEIQDMIRCFDLDKDGKLSLDEFRKVATRCRMLNES
ncbi:unnamed protein product [Eruca vesicaria subsp. sativa]|uniref:EF-hand domain-containing protein n=1 Tax=Eruca vesicaria subsp. sativa TaxID=29727 RepID=A0ABC8JI11_ERUVS|nr:unnamed protein product [Eruca vesicaria subsp. sativa]